MLLAHQLLQVGGHDGCSVGGRCSLQGSAELGLELAQLARHVQLAVLEGCRGNRRAGLGVGNEA